MDDGNNAALSLGRSQGEGEGPELRTFCLQVKIP
jgi:hypothetical protein